MKEVRNYEGGIAQAVASRNITGYALVFNSESNDLGGFFETIDKNALEGVLERSDILCLLNHNEDKGVLARCTNGEGSLKLTVDDTGLKYEFEAPNTALGEELLEGLRSGDIRASSFAFEIDADKWEKRDDGSYLRTITKFKRLWDISPVYRPAYDATTSKCDCRGLDALKHEEELIETEKRAEQRRLELNEYYKQIRNDYL